MKMHSRQQQQQDQWKEGRKLKACLGKGKFKQNTSRQRKLNKKGWCGIAEGLCIRLSIWHFIL